MASPTDQMILDSLRTALFNIATKGAKEYTVFGRSFTAMEMDDLQKAIEIYERRVDAATQPGINGGTLLIGFGGN